MGSLTYQFAAVTLWAASSRSCLELSPVSKSRTLEIICVNDSVDKFSLAITALRKGLKASSMSSFSIVNRLSNLFSFPVL